MPVSGPKLDNRRILAALIDLAVVLAGGALILAAAGYSSLFADEGIDPGVWAAVSGWGLYYHFACESWTGQTLGKRLMKLRVYAAEGGSAGLGQIALRTLLRPVDGLGVYLVGLLVMLVTGERRRRLGDLVGGTIVGSADAPVAAPPAMAGVAAAPAAAPPAAPVPMPVAEVPVLAPEAPVVMAAPEAPPLPEMRPFDPFAQPEEAAPEEAAPKEAAAPDVTHDDEPADAASYVPDIATPSLKELARDVAAAAGSAPAVEDETVAEPEPVIELAPAPPPPAFSVEPVAEVDADEAAEVEPVAQTDPLHETEPVPVGLSGDPIDEIVPLPVADVEPAPQAEVEEADVTVKSVETVSAIDLVMGEDEPAEQPSADADASTDASQS